MICAKRSNEKRICGRRKKVRDMKGKELKGNQERVDSQEKVDELK